MSDRPLSDPPEWLPVWLWLVALVLSVGLLVWVVATLPGRLRDPLRPSPPSRGAEPARSPSHSPLWHAICYPRILEATALIPESVGTEGREGAVGEYL